MRHFSALTGVRPLRGWSRSSERRIRYLSDSEEVRLRAVMGKNYAARIPEFEVALMTGMRMSEQLTLEWSDIDLDAGTIHPSGSDQKRHQRRQLA